MSFTFFKNNSIKIIASPFYLRLKRFLITEINTYRNLLPNNSTVTLRQSTGQISIS